MVRLCEFSSFFSKEIAVIDRTGQIFYYRSDKAMYLIVSSREDRYGTVHDMRCLNYPKMSQFFSENIGENWDDSSYITRLR